MNTPRRKRGELFENYIKRAAKDLYNGGYLISEIARKLDSDNLTIYIALELCEKVPTSVTEASQYRTLLNQGMTYTQVAEICNRSRACVHTRSIKNAKFPDGHKEYILTDDNIEYLKQWYIDGKTISWIARRLNIPIASVKYRLTRARLYEKGYTEMVTEITYNEKRLINSLLKKGKSLKEIAYEIGRPYNIIKPYIDNKKKK